LNPSVELELPLRPLLDVPVAEDLEVFIGADVAEGDTEDLERGEVFDDGEDDEDMVVPPVGEVDAGTVAEVEDFVAIPRAAE
jgi:hypothetical protein